MRGAGFILNEKRQVVPCDDLDEWVEWMATSLEQRVVAKTHVGGYRVSTVFTGERREALFETAILGAPRIVERYSTWAAAEAGHARWLTATLRELNG
jgi:hypothetical protein